MKFVTLLIVGCVLLNIANSQNNIYTCDLEAYRTYLKDWKKPQNTDPLIQNLKFQKFCQSLKQVQQWNSKPHNYTISINEFSDYLPEQLSKRFPKLDPTPSNRIKLGTVKRKEQSSRDLKKVGAGIPNWQAAGKITPPKDQGNCGSCWAFATAGLYEAYINIKKGTAYDLSEQFVLECTDVLVNTSGRSSSCAGGYLDDSIELVRAKGMPLQTAFPYQASTYGSIAGTPTSTDICNISQPLIFYDKMSGVTNSSLLTRYDNITLADIEILLADGPVAAAIYADSGFMTYSSGVYSGCPADYATAFAGINHAVVIVGLDANKNYIIKNSWGTTWGNQGFATVSSTNNCGLTGWVYQLTWGYQILGSSFLIFLAILLILF